MKSETMGIVTELRSTCETKLPHIKTKKANENKEILNLKSYSHISIKLKRTAISWHLRKQVGVIAYLNALAPPSLSRESGR